MKRKIKKFIHDTRSRVSGANLIQSAMAALYIILAFSITQFFESELSLASLGASSFIAFSFPCSRASRSRSLIGGYCIGIASGLLCAAALSLLRNYTPDYTYIFISAAAVFISMLLMTSLDLKHPPSAALAVAITIDSMPVLLSLAALLCIILLCIFKDLTKKHLRDL